MPNRRTKDRWEHPTYRYAYVRGHRGMACTVIHGSYPLSTGFVWKPASKPMAMRILDERLRVYLGLTRAHEAAMTCSELWSEFMNVRGSALKPERRALMERYFAWVPPNASVEDHRSILAAVRQRAASKVYKQNTLRMALMTIRIVFAWGIERGYLKVNPIPLDVVPAEVVTTPRTYTREQVESVIEAMHSRGHHNQSLYMRFLLATAARPVEALRMTWSDVYDDHCILRSAKGSKRASMRARVIPFALIPDAKVCIDAMRALAPQSERVFAMKSYRSVMRRFERLFGDGYLGLYPIRKLAINEWIRLRWPEEVRTAIAGHGREIADAHYAVPFTAAELARFVQDSQASR